MNTEAGTPLTEEEIRLIRRLERLARDWEKTPNRLWLFSGAGTLYVMLYGNSETNPEPHETRYGGINDRNIAATILGIPNDGGDW